MRLTPRMTLVGTSWAGLGILSWLFCSPSSPLGRPCRHLPIPALALTFDDGPHPERTPAIMARLAAHQVQASFFVLGTSLTRSPALARALAAAGHELELHGATHQPAVRRPVAQLRTELAQTMAMVAELTGRSPRWYRPPYGVRARHPRAYTDLGLRLVTWSWDAGDWPGLGRRPASAPYAPVRPGAILLLHDGGTGDAAVQARTLDALDYLLDAARRQQVPIGPLDRLLATHPASQGVTS